MFARGESARVIVKRILNAFFLKRFVLLLQLYQLIFTGYVF